jgi:hypothetical protein
MPADYSPMGLYLATGAILGAKVLRT